MSNHTPTPWHSDHLAIFAENGVLARLPNHPDNGLNWAADAAFIVKAVNSHDALVKALKVLLEEAENFSVSGVYFNEKCMGHKGPAMAYAVLASIEENS